MNTEELNDYCLSLPEAVGNQPWTEPQYQQLITYTIDGKWFCLFDPDNKFIDVKCSSECIAEMQSKYDGAFPAWHMNKEHWLGVRLESDISDQTIKMLIKQAYNTIVAHLPKKRREALELKGGQYAKTSRQMKKRTIYSRFKETPDRHCEKPAIYDAQN